MYVCASRCGSTVVAGRSTESLAVMSKDEAIAKYSALDRDRKIAVLATYGHELTILSRGAYVPGTEEVSDPVRLRRANETFHRVFSHIRDLSMGESKRFPDDTIATLMWNASPEALEHALTKRT